MISGMDGRYEVDAVTGIKGWHEEGGILTRTTSCKMCSFRRLPGKSLIQHQKPHDDGTDGQY